MAYSGKKTRKTEKELQKQTSKGQFVGTDGEKVIWVFDRLDRNGDFAFTPDRIEKNGQLRDVVEKMIDYESMTWTQVKRQTHDNGKSKHHFLDPGGLSKRAEERIALVCPEESDQIFSFALENTLRIVGLRDGALFHVIWYDPKHQFYPSER